MTCECEPKTTRFYFPLAGGGRIQNDRKHRVELAGGLISDQGIRAIRDEIYLSVPRSYMNPVNTQLYNVLDSLSREWQTKDGSFTKRFANAAWKMHGIKVTPELLTKIGNTARRHSSAPKDYDVEFTRHFNRPADEFMNSRSCWWDGGRYRKSMCALKQCGGMGLRLFKNDVLVGRSWVTPMFPEIRLSQRPEAGVYALFNTYGDASIFETARIMAQLTGLSYKKMRLNLKPMYINNEAGILVGPQEILDKTGSVEKQIILRNHDRGGYYAAA